MKRVLFFLLSVSAFAFLLPTISSAQGTYFPNGQIACNSSTCASSAPVYVGTAAQTTEAAGRIIELSVKSTTQATEIHAEHGGTTGYAGFGARNDRLTDGSGNTLAGWAAVVYGSGASSTLWGVPTADLAVVSNAGANSSGHVVAALKGPLVLGTTTTTSLQESRLYFPSDCKTISDATPAGFVRVGIPSGTIAAGRLDFMVYAIGGSDIQQRSGTVVWQGRNPSGTETCSIGTTLGTDLLSAPLVTTGTITASFTCTTAATNAIDLTISSDSSLTTPTMAICWTLYKFAGPGAVNPL